MAKVDPLGFNTCTAKVEIPASVLSKLITSGSISVTDCKYLDEQTKVILWQSLLCSSVAEV